MIKIGLLVIIAMFAPAGHAYSPAIPQHQKPLSITKASNPLPTGQPTTAVDYTSNPVLYSSPVHKSASTPVTTQPVAQPSPQTPATSPPDTKYDGDCQPTATVGRCADKCPAPEFVRGFDKDTGAVVCGYVTGCPYGDSVALGADCYRNCLNTNPQAATDPTVCYQGTGYSQ